MQGIDSKVGFKSLQQYLLVDSVKCRREVQTDHDGATALASYVREIGNRQHQSCKSETQKRSRSKAAHLILLRLRRLMIWVGGGGLSMEILQEMK